MQGDGYKSIIADLSNISDISSLVEQLPKLDGVVNNAGVNDKSLVKFISKDKIDKFITQILCSCFNNTIFIEKHKNQ